MLCLEKNDQDDYELTFDSNGFFVHVYADVESVEEKYRPYYALLLNTMMQSGFGEMQKNLIEYYGTVDPVSPGLTGILRRFVDKLRVCEDEDGVNRVLSAYSRCKTVDVFLGEVEEVCTYGDDIRDFLISDYDTGMEFLDEGLELMEYAAVRECLKRTEGVSGYSVLEHFIILPGLSLIELAASLVTVFLMTRPPTSRVRVLFTWKVNACESAAEKVCVALVGVYQ